MGEGKRKKSHHSYCSIDSVGSSSNSCKVEAILARKKPNHSYFLRSMSRRTNQGTWNEADSKKLLTALKTSWAAEGIADWNYIASMVDKPQYVCRDAFEKKKAEISLFGKLIRENGVTYDFKDDNR